MVIPKDKRRSVVVSSKYNVVFAGTDKKEVFDQ
jgi:hypothetical protein